MDILVCISKTPDTTAKIEFTEDQKNFVKDGVNFIMNPYDEWYALVRALELKESQGGEVVAINVGPASNDTILRKALAIGADKAVRIDKETDSSWDVSLQIAKYIEDHPVDLILLGKETIDYNGAEVGAMLAERVDMPFVAFASKLDYDGSTFTVEKDIEGGIEILSASGPIVVSAAKGMAEQRIPNMRGIMMAKRKPLEVVEPISSEGPVIVSSFTKPDDNTEVTMIDPENMDELVRLLHEEAKVI